MDAKGEMLCPRCGIWRDTDGDGNCAVCAGVDVEAIKSREETLHETIKRYPILNFFVCGHLPEHLQLVVLPFSDLAKQMAMRETTHPAEVAAGLRKLLEAKDCAVRAALK